jgi:hypothetical protein
MLPERKREMQMGSYRIDERHEQRRTDLVGLAAC